MLEPSQNRLLQFLGRLVDRFFGRSQAPAGQVNGRGVVEQGQSQDRHDGDSQSPRPDNQAQPEPRATDRHQEDFETEIQRFLQFCHANVGALYVWPTKDNGYSGKGLPGAKFKDVFDCSGYVTAGVYFATKGAVDIRATHSAQKLWDTCSPCGGDGPCLAFYGLSNRAVTHVVVVLPDGRVVGQSRGDSTCTNPAIAMEKNARVVYHKNANYRRDLRGFRSLPLKGS